MKEIETRQWSKVKRDFRLGRTTRNVMGQNVNICACTIFFRLHLFAGFFDTNWHVLFGIRPVQEVFVSISFAPLCFVSSLPLDPFPNHFSNI